MNGRWNDCRKNSGPLRRWRLRRSHARTTPVTASAVACRSSRASSVSGEPLRGGPPDTRARENPGDHLRPITDLLDALEYLHAHDILHLDIHAGNVIVSDSAERGAVLIDFGLVRPGMGALSSLSGPSGGPPELLAGELPDQRTDLYAVGRLLLYRLTGSSQGAAKLPREIPGWSTGWTLGLERIITKAVQPDRPRRFVSAREFRKALDEVLGVSTSSSAAEPRELTVGRDRELALMETALERAATGSASVVYFVGGSGFGKTRLLTEARWRAQLSGIAVVDVSFVPPGESAPVLRTIFESAESQREVSTSWLTPLAQKHGGASRERARKAAKTYFASDGPHGLSCSTTWDLLTARAWSWPRRC
jgi:serine/threonine protein kinase